MERGRGFRSRDRSSALSPGGLSAARETSVGERPPQLRFEEFAIEHCHALATHGQRVDRVAEMSEACAPFVRAWIYAEEISLTIHSSWGNGASWARSHRVFGCGAHHREFKGGQNSMCAKSAFRRWSSWTSNESIYEDIARSVERCDIP